MQRERSRGGTYREWRDGGGEVLGDGGRGGEGGLEHGQWRSWAGSGGGEVECADGDVEGGGGETEGSLGRRR